MSEYLTYILWRQREATLPRELERQRVVEERLAQAHSRQKPVPDASAQLGAEPAVVTELGLERVN